MEIRSSRRQFLQTGAGAVGAAFAVRTIRLNAEPLGDSRQPVPASDRIRFGIIGIGMQGSGLLATAITLPGRRVRGCLRPVRRAPRARQERSSATRLFPPRAAIRNCSTTRTIDCIIAAVPDHWHKQVVVDAVSAGKDMYCEKPMSHTAAEGFDMVAAAKKTGRIVQIGSQRVSSVIYAKAQRDDRARRDRQREPGRRERSAATIRRVLGISSAARSLPQNLDWDTWQGAVPQARFRSAAFSLAGVAGRNTARAWPATCWSTWSAE